MPLWDFMYSSVQVWLGLGPMIAHEFRAIDHLEDARGHVQKRMSVGMASLQQQDSNIAFSYQSGCYNTSRRATADHDIVKCFDYRDLDNS